MSKPKKDVVKNTTSVKVSPLQYSIVMERNFNGASTFNHLVVTPDEAAVLLEELSRAVKFSTRT